MNVCTIDFIPYHIRSDITGREWKWMERVLEVQRKKSDRHDANTTPFLLTLPPSLKIPILQYQYSANPAND